jgi:hypothetical protein
VRCPPGLCAQQQADPMMAADARATRNTILAGTIMLSLSVSRMLLYSHRHYVRTNDAWQAAHFNTTGAKFLPGSSYRLSAILGRLWAELGTLSSRKPAGRDRGLRSPRQGPLSPPGGRAISITADRGSPMKHAEQLQKTTARAEPREHAKDRTPMADHPSAMSTAKCGAWVSPSLSPPTCPPVVEWRASRVSAGTDGSVDGPVTDWVTALCHDPLT